MSLKRLAALCLLLPALSGLAAREELAGETETAKPKQRPSENFDDEGAPLGLSRAAKAPTFKLPEMVITGEGESKALARRGESRAQVDTSGGIKANPGEQGASKAQAAALGSKQGLEQVSRTALPAYGQVTAAWGLERTGYLDAFWGRQFGGLAAQLEGGASASDGDRVDTPVGTGLAPRREAWHAGGRLDGVYGRQMLAADASADGLGRRLPWCLDGSQSVARDRARLGLAAEGPLPRGVRQSLTLSLGRSEQMVPGVGQALAETGEQLDGSWEKDLSTELSVVQVTAALGYGLWGQDWAGGDDDRTLQRASGGLLVGMEPMRGTRLRLGLAARRDWSGDDAAMLVAPRVEWEQRLKGSLGFFARFAPEQELPLLYDSLFEHDLALPSSTVRAQRDSFNLRAGVRALPLPKVSLELAAFDVQTEDAILWDDPARTGVWRQVNAGLAGFWGLEGRGEAEGPWGLRAKLEYRWERSENLSDGGRKVTFHPEHQGRLSLSSRVGDFEPALAVAYLGPRWTRQNAAEQVDGAFDLQARLGWQALTWLTAFAEGRNLANMLVQDFEGYPEARPYVGLGATARFR